MQSDFPLIDLPDKEDIRLMFDTIRSHAFRLVQKELEKDGLGHDQTALSTCQKTIDKWIASAQRKLEPNISVNGIRYNDSGAETQAFDKSLSQRIQQLTEQSDNMTAQVIAARKTLPTRRAIALQKRFEVMRRKEAFLEKRRRLTERAYSEDKDDGMTLELKPLERAGEISSTLQAAVNDIENLAVILLEQNAAAQEQARLVKRIRTMAASSS